MTLSEEEYRALTRGLDVLFRELDAKTVITFLQALGVGHGNSITEIESVTEKLSKEEIEEFILRNRNEREKRWKELGWIDESSTTPP